MLRNEAFKLEKWTTRIRIKLEHRTQLNVPKKEEKNTRKHDTKQLKLFGTIIRESSEWKLYPVIHIEQQNVWKTCIKESRKWTSPFHHNLGWFFRILYSFHFLFYSDASRCVRFFVCRCVCICIKIPKCALVT